MENPVGHPGIFRLGVANVWGVLSDGGEWTATVKTFKAKFLRERVMSQMSHAE